MLLPCSSKQRDFSGVRIPLMMIPVVYPSRYAVQKLLFSRMYDLL